MDGYLDEYRQIQSLRELWSHAIMDWLRIMIPTGTVVFGFFSYMGYLENLRNLPWVWLLPFLGWGVFAAALITWRVVVCHIDKQIVRMYPRMLELEQKQKLNWATHVRYYYYNLSKRARKSLVGKLTTEGFDPKKESYRKYEEKAKKKDKDPYSLLLEVWDEHRHKSVTSRGHCAQNIAVGIIIAIAFCITLFLSNLLKPQPFF